MKFTYLYIFLIYFVLNVFCNPPSKGDILYDVTLHPSSVNPGEIVTVKWKHNKQYSKKVISIYLGHSTGMGHAPQNLLKNNIKVSEDTTSITIPKDVTPSNPGNIWIIEIMGKEDGSLTDFSTSDINIL